MQKKMYRDDINGKFLGVCSGIAEYFGIDPTIIRVVWAIAVFAYGLSFWIYIVLGIALPRKSVVMQEQRRQQEFERGPGFDTGSVQDVDARPVDCGCQDSEKWDNTAAGAQHGQSSAQYDENKFWEESRKSSDGEWK